MKSEFFKKRNQNKIMKWIISFKKRTCLKTLMGRGKFLFTLFALLAKMLFSACNNPVNEINTIKNIDGITSTGEAVMVMDTTMVSSKLESITEDGTMMFNNLRLEDIPEKGDIICSAPSKTAPQGFLYKVKEITTKETKTTIVTELATIEEAVEEADIDQTLELTITEVEDEEGVKIVELEQTESMQLRALSASTGIKFDIDKKIDDNLHIKGEFTIKTTFRCQIKIGWFKVNLFEITTQPQFKAKLSATYEGKIEKNITFPITTLKCSPLTLWAGPVPLVFTPKISIDGVLTSKGEVKIQATLIDWDYSYTCGIRYQNGKLEAVGENTSKPAKYLEDIQLVLTGEMKLQPKLSYKYDLYNSGTYAGIAGDFYAKLKVEDKVGTEIKLAFSCGLEFSADAELKILSQNLGKLKITFYNIEWLIWEKLWNNGGPGVYVAGYDTRTGDRVAKLWKNGIEQNLKDKTTYSEARSVFISENDAYVAGCTSQGAAVWKNGVLQNLGSGKASSIYVSGSNVYVSGTYEISSNSSIAKLWKNGIVQNLTDGNNCKANSVFVSGSDVYVAGYEWTAQGGSIAKLWKNGVVENLGFGEANSVFISGRDVYVVGNIDFDNSFLWKNGVMQNLRTGIAKSVYVSGNNVYVAGYEWNYSYNVWTAKLWKNGVEQDLGFGMAEHVFVSGSDVYVSGNKYNEYGEVATVWKNGVDQTFTEGSIWGSSALSVFVVE